MNVTGAKRPEALSRYIIKKGGRVTILTTFKGKLIENEDDKDRSEVKVIETNFSKTIVYEGLRKNFENYDKNDIFYYLKIIKQKILNKYLGQLIDIRVLFIINVMMKTLIYKLSRRKLYKWVKLIEDMDIIISTSPPWPCHILGIFLGKLFNKIIIIEYRDQFSLNHMFSSNFNIIEKKIDKLINENANLVVSISEPMMNYYKNMSKTKNIIVMNGFEQDKMLQTERKIEQNLNNDVFIIRYFGTITSDRLMENLWEAISLNEKINGISFEFFGENKILEKYIEKNYNKLKNIIKFKKSIPHQEALNLMKDSDALLFTETSKKEYDSQKGVLTTKLFEYLSAKRPILAVINKDTEAGKIIKNSNLGIVISEKVDDLYKCLVQIKDKKNNEPNEEYINKYSRESQFDYLFNNI